MSPGGALAVYFVVWWIVLFAMLPIGVRSQSEEGVVAEGSDPGAPGQPMLLKKALWTSLIAAILLVGIEWFVTTQFDAGGILAP